MWRKDELDRINSTTTGPERKAALCMLLEQEATLIASIGRHKVVADVENEDKQVKQFLEAVSTCQPLPITATMHIHLILCSRTICLLLHACTCSSCSYMYILVQRITTIHVLVYTFHVFSSVRPQVPKDGQHLMG